VKALGELGDKTTVHQLVNLLSDNNGFVVTSTMESLSRIGGETARNALVEMLSSNDKEIRRTAIKSLAPFNDIEGIIMPYLNDPAIFNPLEKISHLDFLTGFTRLSDDIATVSFGGF
ncbi:hypothetical protein HKBW3S06_01722, partial [Candidatus Hakubella thermalkaliphila]